MYKIPITKQVLIAFATYNTITNADGSLKYEKPEDVPVAEMNKLLKSFYVGYRSHNMSGWQLTWSGFDFLRNAGYSVSQVDVTLSDPARAYGLVTVYPMNYRASEINKRMSGPWYIMKTNDVYTMYAFVGQDIVELIMNGGDMEQWLDITR
jgi:hypothetical protein